MDQHIRVRRSTIRIGTLLLLVVCTVMVLIGPLRLVEPALAQIPDSGLQRKQLLDEARRTNQLLSEIKQQLTIIARGGSGGDSTMNGAGGFLPARGPRKGR